MTAILILVFFIIGGTHAHLRAIRAERENAALRLDLEAAQRVIRISRTIEAYRNGELDYNFEDMDKNVSLN